MSQSPNSAEVYYKDLYWNDHELTLEYMYRLIAAGLRKESKWWPAHFLERYLEGKPVEKALFINCGNGWAERELFWLGLFRSADAFDYSEELLTQARTSAAGLPINYFQADCNKVELAVNHYDLVVNVAAMHHVQYIDKLTRLLATSLKPEGHFVSFDYVGPHRNQYSEEHFSTMASINSRLPRNMRRKPFLAPHLPTILHMDPTEAIHSELVLPMFERYFYTVERKDLNGAIAYQIMHNNPALVRDQNSESLKCVELLLELDQLYSSILDFPTLFSFFVGKPRKELLKDEVLMRKFLAEEEARENTAKAQGGLYYT